MKSNRSLSISAKIQEYQKANILGTLMDVYPSESELGLKEPEKSRNRVFSMADTLMTMVLTASQEDKTLKNSVVLYQGISKNKRNEMVRMIQEEKNQEQEEEKLNGKKRRGQPKKYKILESPLTDISLNTASYSKARERVSIENVNNLFKSTFIKGLKNDYSHWHGHPVYISDGTYLQMQDTPELRKDYEVKHRGEPTDRYPQGLLQVLINRGSGQIASFKLANRSTTELDLFYDMIDELPENSLILLDDLYNCYEIMAKCKTKNIELVVPAKRKRNYTIQESIEKGDEIIEIKAPKERSSWLREQVEIPESILIRRISCMSPEGKEYILNTTILKKEISQEEIQMLYLTRWDIEIGIREIKTIMSINVLRSKSKEMIEKEMGVSLSTYNLIRKIIHASVEGLSFFPETDIVQKFYPNSPSVFIDKKNRLDNRWSPGRKRAHESHTKRNIA